MSVSVRVTQLSFETPVTSEFADILTSSAESVQTIDENIVTVTTVVVTAISLEIPVSPVVVETITNTQQSDQEIDEAIVGTPPEQPSFSPAPAAFVGGGVTKRESPRNVAQSEQTIDEHIIVREDFVTSATSEQTIDTLISEKRVFESVIRAPVTEPSLTQPVKFDTIRERAEVVVSDQPETSRIKRRQKEEDELILLGVLG